MRKIFTFLAIGLVGYWALGVNVSAQTGTSSPSPSVLPSTSPAGKSVRDAVRERVEEKLNQLSNKPRAYVGKITDIQDSSLVVETKNGIRQIKLTNTTAVIQITQKGRKEIKTKDLAIGNFVVVMGFVEMKDVLAANRILTIEQLPKPSRRAVYGIVQTNNLPAGGQGKGTLTIRHPKKDETWTIETNSKTVVTKKAESSTSGVDGKMEKAKVADIATGDRIVVVGTPDEKAESSTSGKQNTLLARLIHVIPEEVQGLLESPKPSPALTQ